MAKPKLSIIGLGKLGSPMVAAYASKGYQIIGVDINPKFVEAINKAVAPVFEPKLADLLKANQGRISATLDFKTAVFNSDITFIIVPTPSKAEGNFSTEYVAASAKEIGQAIKEKSNYHLVVLTSTVAPGATEKDVLPVLEQYSGKKCGLDFDLCYNPEFIALGNVISGLLFPDFILIGESGQKGGEILENFYRDICAKQPPIKRMNIINAEITKIALNTYVTTKISYANMLAELCEKIPGGNVDVVTDALGCDTRIGRKYLKGALGYGGPCFPRDNRALIYSAGKFGVSLPIAEATDEINRKQAVRITEKISSFLPAKGTVAVLGLSYKIDTDVIEESQGVEIAKLLFDKGIRVSVFDPLAMANARLILPNVIFANSLEDAVEEADLVLIATPWPEFKNIECNWLKPGTILFDCWRLLDTQKYKENAKYISLGVNMLK